MGTIEKQKEFRDCLLYYLDCSYWSYEQLQGMYFARWCEWVYQQRRTVVDPRILMKNDHLLNWFAQQWEVYVERDIERYYGKALMEGVFDQSDIELMIEIAAEQLNHIYPKVLLSKIRRELKFQS